MGEAANWTYCSDNVKSKQHLVDIKANVKNSQFVTPLFEFSGACSGCGETPYVKLISQLFGDREMVANATGCSSIYSGSVPSTPYTTNEKGQDEQAGANFTTLKAVGKQFDGMTFRVQVDVMDCLGCGNCADVCPGNPKKGGKALTMKPLETQLGEAANWTYCSDNVKSKQHLVDIKANVKNSQFVTPLFEFSGACSGCSGACSGCGETPYVKLISQLFGDREMVANATGCSSIYSGSVPSTPYTTNEKGQGPAWANSLFEDFCEFGLGMEMANKKLRSRLEEAMKTAIAGQGPAWANSLFEDFCEFGLGMEMANKKLRSRLEEAMKTAIASDSCPAEHKAAFQEWIEGRNDADKSKAAAEKIIPLVEATKDQCASCATIYQFKDYLVKRSQWIIGGDGASYDIGYGGLDHVIASGEDVIILVLDTEVYSNTGGQSSKATASCATIYQFKDYLVKRSQWIIGGDGASYDIGYGGLDHVIASGEDVIILVLDTEVYSNTGGQSSKATPLGAIAKFAASGKRVRKKDLGMIATTYGYVYVAQIAMGDIGYGGLDHVIASGEDVNILVLDTEVYSNTGGQSSKATPLGAIAKFAASGKRVRKKDLGMIATTYGYVYVAQIAMGADQAQTLKAIREAEAYPGPSLVIAYAPCINHGLKAGMGKSQAEEAKAVECGYWHLWRFNPALEDEGKNPFSLDSKEPNWDNFQDYLKGEVRFASVAKQYPR